MAVQSYLRWSLEAYRERNTWATKGADGVRARTVMMKERPSHEMVEPWGYDQGANYDVDGPRRSGVLNDPYARRCRFHCADGASWG